MDTTSRSLVTIICEPVLEQKIEDDLLRLGATGYTANEGRGRGSAERHAGEIPGVNVRIETITDAALAVKILAHIQEHYFAHYSVIAWVSEVQVIRASKYGPA
ncbi:MAG: hypothetical protein SFW08_04860 [Gemmatimonadaceae bacterium]|nr:hypothetical protein [Gemmatimonadaceae bacterium]